MNNVKFATELHCNLIKQSILYFLKRNGEDQEFRGFRMSGGGGQDHSLVRDDPCGPGRSPKNLGSPEGIF